jgi:hypothetical protein
MIDKGVLLLGFVYTLHSGDLSWILLLGLLLLLIVVVSFRVLTEDDCQIYSSLQKIN